MRDSLRTRSRWFSTALAVACCSGIALEGCSKSNRELSASLSEKAGQEALEAERHAVERRRLESTTTRSKDAAVAKKTPAPAVKKEPLDNKASIASEEKPSKPRGSVTDNQELDNADWAGNYLDRRVKAVSDDRIDEESDEVEPLLDDDDEVRTPEVAVDLWSRPAEEDEGTVRIQKKATPIDPESTDLASQPTDPEPNMDSDEHAWARPSSAVADADVETKVVTSKKSLPADQPIKKSTRTPVASHEKAEAKARVQTLLTQGRSLLNKGEFRQAYTVAQLAQRIAEKEDLYFAAGEDQPSVLVRSVQMKLRPTSPVSHVASAKTAKPQVTKTSSSTAVSPSKPPRTDIPDSWNFAEWKNDPSLADSDKRVRTASNSESGIRITPHERNAQAVAQKDRQRVSKFPTPRAEWAGEQANAALTPPGEFPADKIADASEEPIDQPIIATSDELTPPESPTGESNALAQADWRSQSLDNVAVRKPLLVAPLPSTLDELTIEAPLVSDDLAAVDLEELAEEPSKSKLWIAISAAAGAVLLLLTRRRPIVVRSSDTH